MTSPEAGLARKGAEEFDASEARRRFDSNITGEHSVVPFSGKKVEVLSAEGQKNDVGNSNAQANHENASKPKYEPSHKYVPSDEYILPGADPRTRREAIEKAFFGKAGDRSRPLEAPVFEKPREPVRSFDVFSFRAGGSGGRVR